jgi:hypothetical protein
VVNSGRLADDAPFRMSFSRPGVYAYACMFHPGMNGSIQVLPESAALAEAGQQAQVRGRAEAQALVAQLRSDLSGVRPATADVFGGATVHTADVGLSTGAGQDKLAKAARNRRSSIDGCRSGSRRCM